MYLSSLPMLITICKYMSINMTINSMRYTVLSMITGTAYALKRVTEWMDGWMNERIVE